MSETPDSAVRTYIDRHRAAFPDDLMEWLRIPSVSAQPEHAADALSTAEGLAAKFRETGFPTTEVWPTDGAPAVSRRAPGCSGPAADLQEVLGAPVLFLGVSVPSDGWHAPTGRSTSICSSRESRPPHTCGTAWGRTGAMRTDDPVARPARAGRATPDWKRHPTRPRPARPVLCRRTSR